jgi:signal transduction histidine kinase
MDSAPRRERFVPEGRRHVPEIVSGAGARMSARYPPADPAAVRANRLDLVERLADDLAHEIKNPLHAMVINLEVLRRRIGRAGGSEPDELMRYANVLGSELDRVNRRIELLLTIVRPDHAAEPTTLRDAVEELLEVVEVERERRGIQIVFEPVSVPVRASLPPDVARQLVLDLLLPVMDRLQKGSEIIIRTDVHPGRSTLRIAAAATADGGLDHDPRIEVARAIAVELGGELQASGDALLLSLPVPDSRRG